MRHHSRPVKFPPSTVAIAFAFAFAAFPFAWALGCGGAAVARSDRVMGKRPTGGVALVSNCGATSTDLRELGLDVRTSYDNGAVRDESGYANAAPRAWVRIDNASATPHQVRLRAFGECVIGGEGGSLRSYCQEHPLDGGERAIAPGANTEYRIEADMRFVRHDVEVVVVSLMLVVDGKEHCVDAGAWVAAAQPGE
jgi:hypothetical protein